MSNPTSSSINQEASGASQGSTVQVNFSVLFMCYFYSVSTVIQHNPNMYNPSSKSQLEYLFTLPRNYSECNILF